jgi:hypothetical protein
MAAGAGSHRTTAGAHDDFDALLVGTETGMLVNETSKMVAPVCSENRLAALAGWGVLCLARRASTLRGGIVHIDSLRPGGDSQATQTAKVVAYDALPALLVQRWRHGLS